MTYLLIVISMYGTEVSAHDMPSRETCFKVAHGFLEMNAAMFVVQCVQVLPAKRWSIFGD